MYSKSCNHRPRQPLWLFTLVPFLASCLVWGAAIASDTTLLNQLEQKIESAMPGNDSADADSKVTVTGTLGEPGATTTIDGSALPAPPPEFGGVIKPNAVDSKPWWLSLIHI